MFKLSVKIAAVIVVCSSLAIFWHATAMNEKMDMSREMSVPCLSVCVSGGNAGVEAVVVDIVVPAVALFLLLLNIFFHRMPPVREIVSDIFKKDRHRYLMKTAVMLR